MLAVRFLNFFWGDLPYWRAVQNAEVAKKIIHSRLRKNPQHIYGLRAVFILDCVPRPCWNINGRALLYLDGVVSNGRRPLTTVNEDDFIFVLVEVNGNARPGGDLFRPHDQLLRARFWADLDGERRVASAQNPFFTIIPP